MSRIVRFVKRIAAVEPVAVRSLLGAVATAAGVWGVNVAGITGRVGTTVEQVVIVAGLVVTVLGARAAATPTAAVVARVDDPTAPPWDALYAAGGYADAPTGARVQRTASLAGLAAPSSADAPPHAFDESPGF